ncbi:unnamed protein product [Haemonchus placei]|uniref:Uncharacterized protein n=1 Tax=Haemonchus placei TaxID=6290 RepID=A0A3P7WJM4_HAEPC|nr:unnamed protein product [Haemonchus placei]
MSFKAISKRHRIFWTTTGLHTFEQQQVFLIMFSKLVASSRRLRDLRIRFSADRLPRFIFRYLLKTSTISNTDVQSVQIDILFRNLWYHSDRFTVLLTELNKPFKEHSPFRHHPWWIRRCWGTNLNFR